jgi:uncharacterized membrane protein
MKERLMMNKISSFLKKDWALILLILLGFILGIYFYPSLPDRVPIHWNIHGEVNGYCSRMFGAFGIPLMNLGIYLLYAALPYIDPKRKNYENFKPTYQFFKYIIIIFLVCLHMITLLYSTGVKVNISMFIQIAMSLLFILMGNAMGRVKHNYFMGIRTPWTLANEEVWKKTHRLAAPLWVAGGILNLILSLLGAGFYGFIVIIIAISIIPTIYSYIVYQKMTNNK